MHLEELDLVQKYHASIFKFQTVDLVSVLFEVLSMFEGKKKETALHAYFALSPRSRVIPRSILE